MSASITKRVKEARAVMSEFQELEKWNDTLYWRRAEAIFKLKKDNLWKFAYGNDEGTWAHFCANELKIPTSSADQKAYAYEFFIQKHAFTFQDLAPYDTHSLYYIARYMPEATKDAVTERMEQSQHLGRNDIIAVLRGDECTNDHTHNEVEEKVVCDQCKRPVRRIKKKQ